MNRKLSETKIWLRLQARAFLFVKGAMYRMTLGARGVLVDGDRVLLLRHTYVPGWQFPGGGVDPGETIEQAFRREMLEETGYEVTGEAELFALYHNTAATNRDHVAFFVAKEFRQSRTFVPGPEIAEIGWFPIDDLPENTTSGTRARIAEVFKGVARDQTW